MLNNYLKVIVRYLTRKLFFTGLNVAGLSIGLACTIVIFLFIRNELSYDKFQKNADQIYRVIRQSQINGMPYDIGITAAPFAQALREDFSDRIQSVTRAFTFNSLLRYDDRFFIEEKLLLADENFFEFFSYPLSKGDPASVLKNGNSIVISKTLAQKYFGTSDPIGKIIRMDDQYDMVVTGILDAVPGKSHLQFDAVGSMSILDGEPWFNDWWGNAFNTYVKVDNARDVAFLNGAFPDFMQKYFGKDFDRVGNKIGLKLEPLKDIYFNYGTRYENNIAHGDQRYTVIFGSVGFMLLLLAAINYINLATAQASSRAKEVGIRKTLGSSQGSIAAQFLSESFVLCMFAMALGIMVAQLSVPVFNQSFGLSLPGIFSDPALWIFLAFLLITITLASGAYPSFLLSSFKPVKVLKGETMGNLQYLFVRKVLVIFQFGISALMITCTLFFGLQLSYMRNKDLGFKPDQLIVVKLNNGLINRERSAFRQALLQQSDFLKASFSSGHPGGYYDATTVNIQGEDANLRMRTMWTDEEFLETMGLTMAAGRYFSKSFPADSSSSIILNETAVRQLGWTNEEAVGKQMILSQFDSLYKEVIGVIRDYHFTSLKEQIEPLVISYLTNRSDLVVRMSGTDIPFAVATLEKVWNSYNTGFPLDVDFLDDVIGRLYAAERIQGKIFSLFSVISVAIACIGIMGLASLIAAQKRKEIGIRKVLGATSGQVSRLLMKDLLTLVVVANILAIPVGYVAMERWLQGFAYRIELNPLIFLTGAFAVFFIALLIVGLNATKVAMQNPVKALRTE